MAMGEEEEDVLFPRGGDGDGDGVGD